MGDAHTDLARDQDRANAYSEFLEVFTAYIKDETVYETLEAAAKNVDGIRGGYSSGRTNISKWIGGVAEEIKSGDKTAWMRLLLDSMGTEVYDELKSLSPYKNSSFIKVDANQNGTVDFHMYGVKESIIERLLENNKYPWGGRYVLVVDEDGLENLIDNSEIVVLKEPVKG
ncbi:hypothetical protein COU57_01485 [Candidatus Pacearchaeota archaeon CG10_big_fil_rev_8_21_14_0_10_32_14]|nr:MAG: hypothetical protein COU57_01485 [Candidatus Pacearchaeota archaeon CG10_big_fil_rev_8_21_14_0_10_32_14]